MRILALLWLGRSFTNWNVGLLIPGCFGLCLSVCGEIYQSLNFTPYFIRVGRKTVSCLFSYWTFFDLATVRGSNLSNRNSIQLYTPASLWRFGQLKYCGCQKEEIPNLCSLLLIYKLNATSATTSITHLSLNWPLTYQWPVYTVAIHWQRGMNKIKKKTEEGVSSILENELPLITFRVKTQGFACGFLRLVVV